jgi:DNA-binding SARP family transcriptional activator
MARLEIRLLGEIEVRRDGQLLDFPTQKVKELLVYLVLQRDRAHPRTMLANLLWPDADEERGRSNLRKALSFLRKMLGSERWLITSGGAAQFNTKAGDFWLDSQEFEQRIEQGIRQKSAQSLEQAVALYRGTPLADIYED